MLSKLPFSKAPKCIVFTDKLPVTSTGKYQRNKAKPLFAQYQGKQFKKYSYFIMVSCCLPIESYILVLCFLAESIEDLRY